MTLGEWLDRWLTDYKENTVRPGTLAGYRSCIENYIKPQLGGKQVSLVTSQDVQKLYPLIIFQPYHEPVSFIGNHLYGLL